MAFRSQRQSISHLTKITSSSLKINPSLNLTTSSKTFLLPQFPRQSSFSTRSFSSSSSSKSTTSAPSSDPYYRKQPKSWYKSPALIVLACVPLLTGFLGYWQIQRLKWKLSLIEELEDKLRREPMRLPSNIKSVSQKSLFFSSYSVTSFFPDS